MKSTLFTGSIAVLAAVLCVAAQAQTGRPSTTEVRAADAAPHTVVADQELGSYGRYLMLNGATREAALDASRNIDHPAAHRRVASRDAATAGAQAAARQ
jgi:hypothetical protein